MSYPNGKPKGEVQRRALQRDLNHFTGKYLKGVQPLIVDGVLGHATRVRVMAVQWYLGYGKKRNGEITPEFADRMRQPRSTRFSTAAMIATGIRRRAAQKARWARIHAWAIVAPGVTRFDGKPCAKWLAVKLQKARDAGRWNGGLNSGWRDPLYSRALCIQICGAAMCPGRCAGTSSNHVGVWYPHGAVDVSDYGTFAAECKRLGLGICNALGSADPVHFSVSGR